MTFFIFLVVPGSDVNFPWMDYTVNDNDRSGVAACIIFIGFLQYSVVQLEKFVSLAIEAYNEEGRWDIMES